MRIARPGTVLLALPLALVIGGGPLAAAADEASKAPKAILADMSRDLAQVSSYHVTGTETDATSRARIAADVSTKGEVDVTLRLSGFKARIIVLPSAFYLKGDAGYWKAVGGKDGAAAAKQLANRWVKGSGATAKSFGPLLDELSPRRLASCAASTSGSLRKAGTATLAGKPVVVLVDKGDKPGTAPGRLYVTTTTPVLPLRVTQTGPRRPGGHVDHRCVAKDDTTRRSDLHYSRFDEPLEITAPQDAIDLSKG